MCECAVCGSFVCIHIYKLFFFLLHHHHWEYVREHRSLRGEHTANDTREKKGSAHRYVQRGNGH